MKTSIVMRGKLGERKDMKKIIHQLELSDILEVSITAKRWFQKTWGNTYHSVSLSVVVTADTVDRLGLSVSGPGGRGLRWVDVAYADFEYGYGRSYEQTALALFEGVIDKKLDGEVYLSRYAEVQGLLYSENVYDVSRKKDL